MSEDKKQKKPKSKARKIASWITTGIFVLLLGFVITVQIVSNVSKSSNYGVPNFNGMQICIVLTDSMEDKYMVNDALFVQKVDPATLQEGDDITFYYEKWKGQFNINPIVTHRIKKIEVDESKAVGSGRFTFTCHGINTHSENCKTTSGGYDEDCTNQPQVITEQYVLGKVVGSSKVVGQLYQFVTSIWGLIVLLGIPALYLIITSVIDLVKALKEPEEASVETKTLENKEDKAETKSSLEGMDKEDIERLKKEMLEEMMGKKKDD